MKKLLALLLAAVMVLSMAACGGNSAPAATQAPAAAPSDDAPAAEEGGITLPVELTGDYDEDSAILYDYALGEFAAAYDAANDPELSTSEAWALMAVAEAKLMEAGVMVPTTTRGGRFALSRVAPHSLTPILYGNDQDRFMKYVVATEFIKASDRAAMNEKYNELKGTGEYHEWAKNYLVENGYTLTDTYNMAYSSDPKTWDYLATSRAADSEAITNTLEMLYAYDCEGIQQPALATDVTVSDDGLVYTFTLREGQIWVDSQGRKVADLTADDFVAGFQHMLDAMGGLEFLVDGKVKGVHEYINAEDTNFENVGVKAVDKYTLEYTLEEPCRYFLTMLGYNPFAPMNREYFISQGGAFGEDYDPSNEAYVYGTTPNNIAYCGPYLVTNNTLENTIVFQANKDYWDADNVEVKTLTWLYDDGSDPTRPYENAKSGVYSGVNLTTNTVELAKKDGLFDEFSFISSTEATSFMAFWNINRAAYANVNDETVAVSPKTEEQKAETYAALLNQNFRLAVSCAMDRATYNAQSNGEDLKLNSLRNCYTPGNFVTLIEDVTIDINGTATDFAAGTAYGAIMQAQMDADGYKIKVYDPNGDNGAGSSDGFDGWYNPEYAAELLAKAAEELAAQGVEVSAEHPITVDFPYPSNVEVYVNRAQALKKSVEASLGGAVIFNLVDAVDYDGWYNNGYYTDYGYEANYDAYDCSGWGPDYGDPSTYLDTFLPDYAGYMIKCIGIY